MRHYLSRRNNDFGFNFFDDMFENFFTPTVFTKKDYGMKTDVKETDAGFELAVDLPGFDKKDIVLSLDNGYLTVEAKREEKEEDQKSYLRRERSYSLKRSYFVGEAVTEEDIKAKYLNGTLTLSVPKKEIKELPKKNIEID